VRLHLDECLPYRLALALCAEGRDASHPRTHGGSGGPDHAVLARCVAQDRVLVTHDAADFRRLVGRTHIHPGLVILEAADRATTERMVRAFLDFVEEKREQEDPATYMVNRVVEVTSALVITTYKLPEYE
jgi:predicted nuclease of predicted toxin-antitoxin system